MSRTRSGSSTEADVETSRRAGTPHVGPRQPRCPPGEDAGRGRFRADVCGGGGARGRVATRVSHPPLTPLPAGAVNVHGQRRPRHRTAGGRVRHKRNGRRADGKAHRCTRRVCEPVTDRQRILRPVRGRSGRRGASARERLRPRRRPAVLQLERTAGRLHRVDVRSDGTLEGSGPSRFSSDQSGSDGRSRWLGFAINHNPGQRSACGGSPASAGVFQLRVDAVRRQEQGRKATACRVGAEPGLQGNVAAGRAPPRRKHWGAGYALSVRKPSRRCHGPCGVDTRNAHDGRRWDSRA